MENTNSRLAIKKNPRIRDNTTKMLLDEEEFMVEIISTRNLYLEHLMMYGCGGLATTTRVVSWTVTIVTRDVGVDNPIPTGHGLHVVLQESVVGAAGSITSARG